MGKKVNIWLDDTTLKLWEKIPSGKRSSVIKEAIRNNSSREIIDPKTEMINMKLAQLQDIDAQLEDMEKKRDMLRYELKKLTSGENMIEISKQKFWDSVIHRASTYQKEQSVYHSYSGKSAYSISIIEDDKIYINNLRTGRKNSNFSRRTTDIAIDRLMIHGGKIPVGQFIPVKMHEYTVVALHPNLIEKDGFVCWIREEVELVTDEMIPEHNNELPPEEWVSNDNFLAVLIDGKKALIGQGKKIVIFTREEHPILGISESDSYPWQTKYWKLIEPGALLWGHESKTQKVITYATK